MRRRQLHTNNIPGELYGRLPGKVNPLFKLCDGESKTSYRLAHISVLSVVRSPTPDSHEGVDQVAKPVTNHVVREADIHGMAHLISGNPESLYLINKGVDVHTWNDIHDGN